MNVPLRNVAPIKALPPASLLACPVGIPVRVERIFAELDCAQRLRELGIVEGAEVTLLRRSDPLLVLAKDSRIAIDWSCARMIEVVCSEEAEDLESGHEL